MADRHELIKWKVISDWTGRGRGRLFCMNQGMATPLNGDHPIWFGPLKRKFKGFPDLFGFSYKYVTDFDTELGISVPIFTVVEVKIPPDYVKPHQARLIDSLVDFGCNAYIAVGNKDNSCSLIPWDEYKKRRRDDRPIRE